VIEKVRFEKNSGLERIGEPCFSFCSLDSICIPGSIKTLGLLFQNAMINTVRFEEESTLERIEKRCFDNCRVRSIRIPKSVVEIERGAFHATVVEAVEIVENHARYVIDRELLVDKLESTGIVYVGGGGHVFIWKELERIEKFCFVRRKIDKFTFEEGCRLRQIEESSFNGSLLEEICISKSIEVLCRSCFEMSRIGSLVFESESRLATIEEASFRKCSTSSICIPRSVESLGVSCFEGATIESLTFEPESRLQRVGASCFAECCLPLICIPRSVEVLSAGCFADSKIPVVTFESDSRVTSFEDSCFARCALKSLCVPRSVERLGTACFSGTRDRNNALKTLTFEAESRLTNVGERCFACCSLKSVQLPAQLMLALRMAFDWTCVVKIEGREDAPEVDLLTIIREALDAQAGGEATERDPSDNWMLGG
jgi:hypothetical protein